MNRNTRQQKSTDQATMEGFLNRKEKEGGSDMAMADIAKTLEELKSNQTVIKDSIASKNEKEDARQARQEAIVESLNSTVTRLAESLDKIIPRVGVIETRLNSIEEKLSTVDELERKCEDMSVIEEVLPRLGEIEDRVNEMEKTMEENSRLKKRIETLEETNLIEEYERKKENLVIYGLKGSEKPEQTVAVVKTFMTDNLKLDPQWVSNLNLKAAIRLQGSGEGPTPIRISFFYPSERDKCLRAGPNLKGTNMSIRTDLPRTLRVKRAGLANKGYRMKKDGECKLTRMREKGIDIWLDVKRTTSGDWERVDL